MEETLTVPRLKALNEEWRIHPPLPLLVASYLGFKPQERGTQEALVERLATLGR